jgi:hypothetical protein
MAIIFRRSKLPDHPREQALNIDLEYPAHLLELKDNMADFIYEDGFWEDWKECGLNVEKDLWDLEASLTAFPEAGSVIPGTGG